jgi:hypothetical protein
MNKMLKVWLHYAALAAASFSGQAYWAQAAEFDRAVAPKKAIKNKPLSGFGPALRAAD